MDFVIDQLKLLGLNSREMRVFTTLSTFGRMNMTNVARRAQLPRTTVDAIIRRLREQGLLEKHLIKNHFEWSVDLEEVTKNLSNLETKLSPHPVVSIQNDERELISAKGVSVTEHASTADLLKACDETLARHVDEKGVAVLGSVSDACFREEEYFRGFCKLLNEHRVTLEMITARSVLRLLARSEIKNLASYKNQFGPSVLVSDESIQFDGEDLLIFDEEIVIFDIGNRIVTSVRSSEMSMAIRKLFMIADIAGEKIDLSEYIQALIEEREKA